MKSIFGANWKTTAMGYLGAILLAGGDLLSTGGVITAKTLGMAIFSAVAGRVMKDAGMTGPEK